MLGKRVLFVGTIVTAFSMGWFTAHIEIFAASAGQYADESEQDLSTPTMSGNNDWTAQRANDDPAAEYLQSLGPNERDSRRAAAKLPSRQSQAAHSTKSTGKAVVADGTSRAADPAPLSILISVLKRRWYLLSIPLATALALGFVGVLAVARRRRGRVAPPLVVFDPSLQALPPRHAPDKTRPRRAA
jgi:hypothetical protein